MQTRVPLTKADEDLLEMIEAGYRIPAESGTQQQRPPHPAREALSEVCAIAMGCVGMSLFLMFIVWIAGVVRHLMGAAL